MIYFAIIMFLCAILTSMGIGGLAASKEDYPSVLYYCGMAFLVLNLIVTSLALFQMMYPLMDDSQCLSTILNAQNAMK